MKPLFSVVLCTARQDFPVTSDPTWHVFGGAAACLQAQTEQDFEWIVVDLLYEQRRDWFELHPRPFPVRHMPVKDNFWTRQGRRARAAALNTGLEAAEGEFVAFFDDAWLLPPNWLEVAATWVGQGKAVGALYKGADSPTSPPRWNDDRYASVMEHGSRLVGKAGDDLRFPPTYGGLAAPRDDLIRLGGYEELMDASWGLEDIEMGVRLRASGVDVALDERFFITALPTTGHAAVAIRDDRQALCCENLFRLKLARADRGELRSNVPWTDEERAAFLPSCRFLTERGTCDAYGPDHVCVQPRWQTHPDVTDLMTRKALGLL